MKCWLPEERAQLNLVPGARLPAAAERKTRKHSPRFHRTLAPGVPRLGQVRSVAVPGKTPVGWGVLWCDEI